ncbi:hypothetical protein FD723_39700 (plasmid) [Nostoc sp. C052]|uniref:hypothetical protein n=1 Tax=Nostoc sp. C052 TaxID=2576902 RepID=UPI0015C3C6AA|nr:hypothetical protein [Nostoc sp. C052]QLE46337.1 hypothetical protein FD723_39700 [Nostoc sp. C052]
MPEDYSRRSFVGDVLFPKFETGKILGIGEAGIVNAIDLPILKSLVFYQTTPSTHWQFTHDFGIKPFVSVYSDEDINITDAVEVSCTENLVDVRTENNPITGRIEVYSLGQAPGVTNGNSSVLAKVTKNFTLDENIAINANYSTSIEIAKVYQLLQLNCSTPARFRIYLSESRQILDSNRQIGNFPTNESGLIFEGFTSSSNSTIDLCPIATGYNLDDTSNSYITITNLSETSVTSLEFSLTYLPLVQ